MPREPVSAPDAQELFLNDDKAAESSLASSIAASHSVLVLAGVASIAECENLASLAAAAAGSHRADSTGMVRKRVADLIGDTTVCNELLLRQLARLDAVAPSLTRRLFGDVLRETPSLFENPRLAWSNDEPAINVYAAPGGTFGPHKDNQSLTMLLNLSPVQAYEGGGTAFWARQVAAAPTVLPPTFVLAPPAGSALVFGGRAVHAARPITSGERVVLVASCSLAGLSPHGRRCVP